MCRLILFITFSIILCLCGIFWKVLYEPGMLDSLRWRLGIAAPEIPAFNREMRGHLRRETKNADMRRIIFIGDSLIQGMDVSGVDCGALNLGIGGDTTNAVLKRIPDYRGLSKAKAIVLLVGINDYSFRRNKEIFKNYKSILDHLERAAPVFAVSVLPVNVGSSGNRSNELIRQLNKRIESYCVDRCTFVSTHEVMADEAGNLKSDYAESDGIHLSPRGYSVLKGMLKYTLNKRIGLAEPCWQDI